MKYTKSPHHNKVTESDFKMPTERHFRCDRCQRRKPSHQAVVEGLYVYCRKCVKERRKVQAKRVLDKNASFS